MAYNTHYTESSSWTNDVTPNDADHVADIYASLGPRFTPSDFGAVADVESVVVTELYYFASGAGTGTLAASDYNWDAGDIGKWITVANTANDADKGVTGYISNVTSGNCVLTSATGPWDTVQSDGSGPTVLAGATVYWGTDNATEFQALEAAVSTGDTIIIDGAYMTSDLPPLLDGQRWVGKGPNVSKLHYIGANDAIAGVDLDDVELSDFSLIGQGRLGPAQDGINITTSSQSANNYLTLRNLFVQGFGQDGINIQVPIVSTFERVVSFQNRRNGIRLWQTGGSAGTSCTLNNCFAGGNWESGYLLDQMAYTTLNSCAADANGVGFEYDTCNGIVENGCGTEEPYEFGTGGLGFTSETVSGVSRYIFNTKITMNAPYSIGNIGTAVVIDNNAKVVMNSPYEGSAGVGNTYSIDVQNANCDVVVNNPSFVTPINGGIGSPDVSFNASAYDTLQDAIDACESVGGGKVTIPPGTYNQKFTIDSNVPIHVYGYGATLNIPANNDRAITITQGNGGTIEGCKVEGLLITNSNSRTGAVGVELKDTDGAHLSHIVVEDCAVGITHHCEGAGNWVERCTIDNSFVRSCTIGIQYVISGGNDSFNECALVDVGVTDCGTGIEQGAGSNFARTTWRNVSVWVYANQLGVKFDGTLDYSRLQFGVESFSTTNTTGVYIGEFYHSYAEATSHDLQISFVGSFTANQEVVTDINYPNTTANPGESGQGIIWRDGGEWWASDWSPIVTFQKEGDSEQSLKIAPAGIWQGDGTYSPVQRHLPIYGSGVPASGLGSNGDYYFRSDAAGMYYKAGGAWYEKMVKSETTGITGADPINNIVSLTQAEYDAIGTPDANTFYVING